MANRIPLVLETGRTQQHQPDDTLQLRTDAASGTAKLLMVATDAGEATCFEIRVYDDALLNLAFGINAGAGLTTGSQNICIGASAGTALTTGINNTAIGFQALQDLSGAFNSNTAVGPNTMRELNAASGGGQNNTAIGPSAMRDLLTGSNNVAIGTSAMLVATDADSNTFIGQGSGGLLTTGDNNVGIGVNACRSITTGGTNSFVGNAAGNNASQKVDAANSTGIGNGTFTTADNQVVIGNTSVTACLIRGGVTLNEAGIDADMTVLGDTLTHMIFCDASAATENIALLATGIPNWQTMDRGLFIGDSSTAPTGNPTAGVFGYCTSADLFVRNGVGAITQLSGVTRGATASVADGGTITHNLGSTPVVVLATGSVAGEIVSVTAIGATTFTVAIKLHDGTAGTSQTIYWQASES